MIKKLQESRCKTPPGENRDQNNYQLVLRTAALSAVTVAVLMAGCSSDNDVQPTDTEVIPPVDGDPPLPPIEPTVIEPESLRSLIDQQVNGIETLMVPAENSEIPVPLLENGEPDPLFVTTEAKRYLGKLLFHDPIRTVRIVPEFDGDPTFTSTASCGSCHFGEAGSKAGQQINFAVGGEGKGYTDAEGNFVIRRRARTDVAPRLRDEPLFPGDALVDALPTLTDIYENAIGSPALSQLNPGELLATGRLDAIDSVSRMSPSVVGFAFNNRLLLDGFAGEDNLSDGGLNPFDHSAQENLTLLLLDAHRMFSLGDPQGPQNQAQVLAEIPAYVQLFREAFPEEAAEADAENDIFLLIKDQTILRATASYLRTVVTRNTPWDRFLAADDDALTPTQRRGAELFFTEATGDAGGAGCFGCHSGPMLNKQPNDTDVTGVGDLIEENFYNLGLNDHPVHALAQEARMDPTFRDTGRAEITGNEDDVFKFRSLTLRQLRDGRNFMHSGEFTSVAEVVNYFNIGVPLNEEAGMTASPRFTNPRGEGTDPGLGLSNDDVAALTDFLENALYDEAFVTFDPDSTTDTLQLNEADLTYSANRPELADLGAVDGFVLSGLAQDSNDPLSRRDQGLETLDVTLQLETMVIDRQEAPQSQIDQISINNNSDGAIDTHLLVVVENLPAGVELTNAEGIGSAGDPFVRLYLDTDGGTLQPGNSISTQLNFSRPGEDVIEYNLVLLSGQGIP
ncbi:MAG: cytochrome-c peroxidase [Granulosicoccus sp.]